MEQAPFLRSIRLLPEFIEDPDAYPFNLPAFRGLGVLDFHPKVTFLVGENGSGKSTLLEALAVRSGLNPEGGGRHHNFATRETHSKFHQCLRIARGIRPMRDSFFLRAESYYNVATEIERLDEDGFRAYGGRSPHEQSHGESFLALVRDRFVGNGLYLLDEPEAALSPSRQLGFLALLHELVLSGSQLVIATHSPLIMAYPHATIYGLDESGVRPIEYRETEHYRLTKYFLDHPDRMLGEILGERAGPTSL